MCYIPRRNFLGLLAFMTASYVSVGIGHRAAKAQADNCVQGYGYLEAYTSSTSVFPGESLSIHVRAAKAYNSFYIDIYRMGKDEVYIPLTQDGQRATGTANDHTSPENAYEAGCDWPPAFEFEIPEDWSSGAYIARLTGIGRDGHEGPTTEALFVVKASAPGMSSNILLQLAVTTEQAYNPWGGKNLYSKPHSPRVAFDRPTDPSRFYLFELPFIAWLESNGFELEYCTGLDLHADPGFMDHYQLMLSVGHDEYWSKEMRDNVEAFVATGGNVAFFSGNVCWWQVRFERGNQTMVCYKSDEEGLPDPLGDPNDPNYDPSRVTVHWWDEPVYRPENSMTGVSFRNGAGWWTASEIKLFSMGREYIADLNNCTVSPMVGEEFGRQNKPLSLDAWIVRTRSDVEWKVVSDTETYIIRSEDQVLNVYEDDYGFQRQARPITGYSVRNSSHWVFESTGLNDGDTFGAEHEGNIVGYETDTALFREVTALAIVRDRLFASTRDNKLCWRNAVGQEVAWQEIGDASYITAMAALDNKLFAVTYRNRLLWRDPVGEDVNWEEIGHANSVVAMAAIDGKLYAATRDNKLWWRDPVGEDVNWEEIGHANNVVAMAAIDGKLFAATRDNKLWWRDPVGEDVNWEVIGHAKNVVAMAAIDGKLFAATRDNKLWWRDPVGEDVNWEVIGHACEDYLQVSGDDGTPLNFVILATADLTAWKPGGQAGMATMGMYTAGGTVFTAATTDWVYGLAGSWNTVQQITHNVLSRLSCPCSPRVAMPHVSR